MSRLASPALLGREPRGRVRYLSEEERARLLGACRANHDSRLYSLVVMALGTGARQGELLRLCWRDVDLKKGVAVLHQTKNLERRTLVLAGRVLDVLRELSSVRRIGTDEVFVGRRGVRSFDARGSNPSRKRSRMRAL